MSGLKIAALYGIIPHQLGFCGPQNKTATQNLLKFIDGEKIFESKIRRILKEFKGAFIYYQLIAKVNKINDPFDERVVRAYWLGNRLLDKTKNFEKFPFHAFHVLKVGSITGRIVLKGKLLDICRVSWGKVIKMSNSKKQKTKIVIEYQPLIKKDEKSQLGKLTKKEISWNKKMTPEIKIGDWVSVHWNYAIQVLVKKDLMCLKKYTQITLKKVNQN